MAESEGFEPSRPR